MGQWFQVDKLKRFTLGNPEGAVKGSVLHKITQVHFFTH